METTENVDDKNSPPKEKAKNTICFFFLGVLLFIFDEMCLTAAEDIISGSRIATTSVIIAIALPVLAVKTFVPWFLQMCSYLCKTCIVVCLLLTGLVVVVWVEDVQWRLFGVSVVESGTSVGEITFLALTASYQDTTVSAFVAGIGAASLLGPLYYTGEFIPNLIVSHYSNYPALRTFTHACSILNLFLFHQSLHLVTNNPSPISFNKKIVKN